MSLAAGYVFWLCGCSLTFVAGTVGGGYVYDCWRVRREPDRNASFVAQAWHQLVINAMMLAMFLCSLFALAGFIFFFVGIIAIVGEAW
jgi:hypothetical protein